MTGAALLCCGLALQAAGLVALGLPRSSAVKRGPRHGWLGLSVFVAGCGCTAVAALDQDNLLLAAAQVLAAIVFVALVTRVRRGAP